MAQSWADTGHTDQIGLGDHACQFFLTAEDLSQTLIPYFKMGLERNEACVWVTAPPYPADRALSELREAVPYADRLAANGQLLIYPYDEWYLKYAELGLDELVRVWLTRAQEATDAGYAGLRISGNGSFVAREAWPKFMAYEQAYDAARRDQPIATLCSYWLNTCDADDVLDVLHCHDCGWAKHKERWEEVVISRGRERDGPLLPPLSWQAPHEITQLMEELLHFHAGKIRLEGSPLRLSTTSRRRPSAHHHRTRRQCRKTRRAGKAGGQGLRAVARLYQWLPPLTGSLDRNLHVEFRPARESRRRHLLACPGGGEFRESVRGRRHVVHL